MAKTKLCFFVFLIFTFFSALSSFSQNKKYIVYFKYKNNTLFTTDHPEKFLSTKAINRREKQNIPVVFKDLPVDSSYIDSISAKGATVLYLSKWMNAAIVSATDPQIAVIEQCSFVLNFNALTRTVKNNSIDMFSSLNFYNMLQVNYGNPNNQISMLGADLMHEDGFHGEGKLIAVFDAGFKNAPSLDIFADLFLENRVKATYDFVDKETNVYDNDQHGTNVLSTIAGYKDGTLIGTAYKSDFILLRTENENSENFIEEANWLRAAEYSDSAGVDIISSSLGYSTFDNTSESHSYADMNGNTTIITKAANMAASTGMMVVSSAGNEGQSSWKYITAPADGSSVLTIGAVDGNGQYALFSSIGPTADGRIKPDVVAKGANTVIAFPNNAIGVGSGTSFSCPLVAGFIAGIWQAYPQLTVQALTDIIKKTASNFNSPNNQLGYGIPNYKRIKEYIESPSVYSNPEFAIFPNPVSDENLYFISEAMYVGDIANVQLYDALGNKMYDMNVSVSALKNDTLISTSYLSKGLYEVVVSFRDKKYCKKLVKN